MRTHITIFLMLFYSIQSLSGQCILTGADLSYTNEILSNGGIYKNENGDLVDPFEYFASKGTNIVRLRLWHTPSNIIDHCENPINASSLDDVLNTALKVKANGMQLKLSIHYSDYFVDPSKQKMPSAWEGLSHLELLDSISNYTKFVLDKLYAQSTLPEIVSIGNETTWGFIDETSSTNGFDWDVDNDKFNVALNAIDSFNLAHNTEIKKAVHFTESSVVWGANTFINNGVENFDIIGVSYYPFFSPDVSLNDIGVIINELTTLHDKEVMIFETGFASTANSTDNYNNFISNNGNILGFPMTAQGQKEFLLQLAETIEQNNGTGLIYWEPAWVTSSMCDLWGQGSSYENVTLYDENNLPLESFDFFDYCSTSVGTKKALEDKVKIFPNPIKFNELTIKDNSPFTKWEIIDITGKILLNGTFDNENFNTIKIPNYFKGLYILRMYSNSEEYLIRKFILR